MSRDTTKDENNLALSFCPSGYRTPMFYSEERREESQGGGNVTLLLSFSITDIKIIYAFQPPP
ncbi:MAG: hypothetical protein HW399_41 [Dehalococcoidia bacterium]|nr:hypothetical protein [Dehalococcoidia bacterium]